jgi:signal peptidase II
LSLKAAPLRGALPERSDRVGRQPHTPHGLWIWLGWAAIVGLADQFTKLLIVGYYQLGDSVAVTGFFNVVRVHNAGAAFSFLSDASGWQRWFFTAIGIAAAVVIVGLLRAHQGQRLFCTALTLILSGAVGNVIDRLMYGHVIDFIDLHWAGWHFPAFNVADSSITLGATLLVLDELQRLRRT